MNRDTAAARRYHDATAHSVARLHAQPHSLDWDIKPLPFKVFPQLEPLPLPRELPPSSLPALQALAVREVLHGAAAQVPDVRQLARLLHFSAGITRKRVLPDGAEYHFRAAACTGALYHIDLYVVCGDLPGVASGVYHFGPHNFALHQLRAGDHRGVLVDATGGEWSVAQAPIIIACASTYWRNAWKYQARAYRHCFWDTGTILANLLAVAAAAAIPARVVCGFVDATVSALLGLDAQREGPLALVSVGYDPSATPRRAPVAPLVMETLALSTHEVDYPAIREMQAASALQQPDDVAAWRKAAPADAASEASSALPIQRAAEPAAAFPLRPRATPGLPAETIDSVILRRGSTRRFAHTAIAFEELSTLLQCSTRGVASDFGDSPSELYLIVNAVTGLAPGAYAYRRDAQRLELLRAGDFRRQAGFLGLGQELPADAAVNIYVLCALEPLLARFGNRGYRVAQLDAALTGGKLYLAAYALRLGATGLTFFDDEVTEFFSPHAAGKSVMFLMAIGRGRRAVPQVD